MKKVLCFGDSNTFGYIPGSGLRYDKDTRWTGILQNLGKGIFKVTEAGCNNRTCTADNPAGKMFTGYKILPEFLNLIYDCVILAIGLNDFQYIYDISPDETGIGLEKLINIVKSKLPESEIIIISPSRIGETILKNSVFSQMFDKTSIEKSLQIGKVYETAAKSNSCRFIDLDKIAVVSNLDGLHYDKKMHILIANAVFEVLRSVF